MFRFCHFSGQPDLEGSGVEASLCYIFHQGDGISQTERPFAFPAHFHDQKQRCRWNPKVYRIFF